MKFQDYEKDEREQWAKQALTKAYLDELADRRESARQFALDAVAANDIHGATRYLGTGTGLQVAINIGVDDE